RDAILRAARREFSQLGYHGASTASIARTADCSEPMLYKHFAGKQALFTAVLEEASAAIETAFDTMLADDGNFMDEWANFLPGVMADPQYVEFMRLRKLAVTIAHEPSVRDTLETMNARHLERVRFAIERGIARGTVRPDIDPEYVAWTWTGLMLAGCLHEVLEPGGFSAMTPHVLTFLSSLRPEWTGAPAPVAR
ncbi:MAG: TetR family transcriptional regulator, partial [Thermoleophilia bacterium]|nr:TetR family transcriptional regulator [Thermoleophilia bacterium]